MTTPDHIKRIIERIDPADREVLEQHLTDGESSHRKLIQCLDDNAMISRERGELAAYNECLRAALNQAIELLVTALHEPEQITPEEIHDLRTQELQSPAASLAEIKAQAIQDAMSRVNVSSNGKLCYFELMGWTESIRQGAR